MPAFTQPWRGAPQHSLVSWRRDSFAAICGRNIGFNSQEGKDLKQSSTPLSEHELWAWGAALPPRGQGLQEDGVSSALFGPITMPFSLWMIFSS